jgi:hypothetical protein
MSRIVTLAAEATHKAARIDLLHSLAVGGCALALILARAPLGF